MLWALSSTRPPKNVLIALFSDEVHLTCSKSPWNFTEIHIIKYTTVYVPMRRGQRSGGRDPRKRKRFLYHCQKMTKTKNHMSVDVGTRFPSYISFSTFWWAHRNGNLLVQTEPKNGFKTKKWRMGFEVRISTPAPCVSSIHCSFIFDHNGHSEMFCACQVLVSKRYIGGTGPYAGRRTVFNAHWFWKDFENAKNFQN